MDKDHFLSFPFQKNSYKPINSRNTPKSFLKRAEGRFTANREPVIEPKMPNPMRGKQIDISIFLFLKWVIKAMDATGINDSKFTLCASCWVRDVKMMRAGMRMVPPPIPMPPIIPEHKPIKIRVIKTPSLWQQ